MSILIVFAVPYLPVSSHDIHFKWLPWYIDHTGHGQPLLVEVPLGQPGPALLLRDQVVEVHIPILRARCKCHVVLKPVDTTHPAHMVLALVMGRTVTSVKVEHTYSIGSSCCCK